MRRAALMLLLVLATVAIYAQVVRFDFIHFDDPSYVTRNAQVLGGISAEGVAWAFTTRSEANWHPLTWLSLMLDAEIGGPGPRMFHLTNVALHALNALLVFLLFERMTGAPMPSAFVAALFAVHPVHVESVAWVAERKDVLSTALGLAALHGWLTYVRKPGAPRALVALALYAASLMAKPMLVSLPILMLLVDGWPLEREAPWRRRLVEKIPWFGLAAASCLVTFFVQSHGGATRNLAQYPLPARAANALMSYVLYLRNAIWPSGLAVYYPYPYEGIPAWKLMAAAGFLATVTWACVRVRAAAPYLLFGWAWYVITLVPVIGLVQVGSQSMADRYAYLPLLGPFAMLAWGVGDLVRRIAGPAGRRARAAAPVAACMVLAALAVGARRQAGYWRDTITLFERTLAVTEENAPAHNILAIALFERGEIDRAMTECAEAVRISPGMVDAQSNFIRGLLAQGKAAEAAERTKEQLALHADDSRMQVNAGLIAMTQGRIDDAEARLLEAIRLDPRDQDAHLNLAAILLRRGRRDEAVEHFEEAVRLRPGDLRARRALESARSALPPPR